MGESNNGLAKALAISRPTVIPTSSSWLNLVERWFGKITADCLHHGSFKSVADLEKAVLDDIHHTNANPQPFVGTKSAEDIILKVNRDRMAAGLTPLTPSVKL